MSDGAEVKMKESPTQSFEKARQMTGVVLSLSITLENPLYSNPGMRVFGHNCHSLLKLRSLTTRSN